jgi:hypothetical protein
MCRKPFKSLVLGISVAVDRDMTNLTMPMLAAGSFRSFQITAERIAALATHAAPLTGARYCAIKECQGCHVCVYNMRMLTLGYTL